MSEKKVRVSRIVLALSLLFNALLLFHAYVVADRYAALETKARSLAAAAQKPTVPADPGKEVHTFRHGKAFLALNLAERWDRLAEDEVARMGLEKGVAVLKDRECETMLLIGVEDAPTTRVLPTDFTNRNSVRFKMLESYENSEDTGRGAATQAGQSVFILTHYGTKQDFYACDLQLENLLQDLKIITEESPQGSEL